MTTPFSLAPAAYPGAMPDPNTTPAMWDTTAARFWLGTAANGMIELPSVDPSNYTATASRTRIEQGLASGASGFTLFDYAPRRWGLSWQRLASRDFDRIKAFDAGMYGDELLYVQPEDRNHLTYEQSMCGALNATPTGWTATTNQPTYDATLPPPIEPSGVLRWTPASASSVLVANYGSTTVPSLDFAVPYLPGEFCTWWFWSRVTSAANTVTPKLVAATSTGTVSGTAAGTGVPLTTTPTLLSVTTSPGQFGSNPLWLLPQLAVTSTAEVQVSCAQLEFRTAPTEWTGGGGVARVSFAAELPRQLDVFRNSGATVTFAETVAGAS